MQSPELTQFYRDYAAWLDVGAPDLKPFMRHKGLCANSASYPDSMYREMIQQFLDAGLSDSQPFNDANNPDNDYWAESGRGTCHLNPARIQWVRDHCNP